MFFGGFRRISVIGCISVFLVTRRVDVLVDFEPMCPGFESRELHDFFLSVIIITVQICKFNITVSTQFLLLYYSL